MATLQMGDTTFEKGDTETEKAPYFRGFGGYPELFKSCFPHYSECLVERHSLFTIQLAMMDEYSLCLHGGSNREAGFRLRSQCIREWIYK